MPLSLIHGLPRSGKTCYAVSRMKQFLTDWVEYERKHGEKYPRKLYTNIPLHLDAINASIKSEIGGTVDVTDYVELIDNTFFKGDSVDGTWCYWWEKFPQGAMIVIDEVHHYLPASLNRKNRDMADAWMNFVSMHGHSGQDILLLTQHIGNVTTEVRKQIETVYSVTNIKSRSLPFPISIPLSDVAVVQEAWGVQTQFSHVRRGTFVENKIVHDSDPEKFFLTPSIFKLYKSHTKMKEAADRPSLKLGKIGSLWWFFKRHVFHITVKILIAYVAFSTVKNVAMALPGIMVDMVSNRPAIEAETTKKPSQTVIPAEKAEKPETSSPAIPAPLIPDDVILGFVRDGVITAKGVIRKEEHLIIDGEKDYVKSVDVRRGILHLGSGKKVQK